MGSGSRTQSPPPKSRNAPDASPPGKVVDIKSVSKTGVDKFETPPRPTFLRKNLLVLHGVLGAGILLFALLGQSMVHSVPEGKFEKKDGTLINILDFDAGKMGPYPKCHPHYGEHEVEQEDDTASSVWVKNVDAPKAGPFPVGHPENPEWLEKSHADAVKDNKETRFKWAGLQPNLHLLALATLCVFIGCRHGVFLFTEAAETREASQVLQKEDAMWFPVMGSCVLFGLFVVLKYLGTDFIKMAISVGIVIMCMFGVGTNFDHFSALVRNKVAAPLFRIPYLDQTVTSMELVGMAVGGAMAVGFLFTKNWIINNLFGVSFCLVGIKMIGISTYKTGTIMLVGLFFYDVFWVFGSKSVFGSNVMVSVAKGVDAPIKLMFPKMLDGCGNLAHSMLGLGDIVVPGIFISFLAKFDAYMMGLKKMDSFVYLNTTMVAYVLSLITTVSIMLFFNAAQPALLYIVPYVLISSALVATYRGEFKTLWSYVIEEDETEEQKKAGEAVDNKKSK